MEIVRKFYEALQEKANLLNEQYKGIDHAEGADTETKKESA